MIEATATDRHTTVARKSASATVTDLYGTTTYELTVTNRHDVPHYLTRVRTRARGKNLRAMGNVATVRDGSRPESRFE